MQGHARHVKLAIYTVNMQLLCMTRKLGHDDVTPRIVSRLPGASTQ